MLDEAKREKEGGTRSREGRRREEWGGRRDGKDGGTRRVKK